jgi:hypothetical protein
MIYEVGALLIFAGPMLAVAIEFSYYYSISVAMFPSL